MTFLRTNYSSSIIWCWVLPKFCKLFSKHALDGHFRNGFPYIISIEKRDAINQYGKYFRLNEFFQRSSVEITLHIYKNIYCCKNIEEPFLLPCFSSIVTCIQLKLQIALRVFQVLNSPNWICWYFTWATQCNLPWKYSLVKEKQDKSRWPGCDT